MPSGRQGSIHLFRLAGVDLYLHWSWFLVAAYEVLYRRGIGTYTSVAWNVAEYLALFLIVLMHEFGHAMACRQVGGTANQILLWPFGGVAYVRPPQRPGATLWSIAAGPLVNVALGPLLYLAVHIARSMGWADAQPDAYELLRSVFKIDVGLLIFNLLPLYPLDGGQILRSLLWFVLGRGRSLMVATIFGLVGGAGLIGVAVWQQDWWLGLICAYMLMNCWAGLQAARGMRVLEKLPRWEGFACPICHTAPPVGTYWACRQCEQPFDTFASRAVCPYCGAAHDTTMCVHCKERIPINDWVVDAHRGKGFVSGSFAAK